MRTSGMAFLFAAPALAAEIALPIPDPIYTLPTVQSTRHIVHEPSGWHDLTYHHRPVIAVWRGRLYLAWHAALRSERTPPVVGFVSQSQDGRAWSKPARFAEAGHAAYLGYTRSRHRLPADFKLTANVMPRTFYATPSRLYLLASAWAGHERKRYWRGRAFYTDDGVQWHEVSPEQLDRQPNLLIRNHWGNGRLMRLADGRLMAACNGRDGLSAPMTTDTTGLSGWSAGLIDVTDQPIRVDPQVWRGPDGVLHYAAGHLGCLWHAFSRDAGRTWTKLTEQPGFPDNRGGAAFGELPDGRVWYLGNPLPDAQRCPLVLAISRNGWRFDRVFVLRKEPFYRQYDAPFKGTRPGYEYPSAVCRGDHLYVAYSVARERIEVSIVDWRRDLRD